MTLTRLTFTHSTPLYATPDDRSQANKLMTIPATAIVESEESASVILQRMGNQSAVLKVIAMGIHGWVSAKYARFAERDSSNG